MSRDAYDDAHYDVRIELPRGAAHPSCQEVADAVHDEPHVPEDAVVHVKVIWPTAG